MILKDYQRNALGVLQRFFEACRISGARDAYRAITGEPEFAARLGRVLCGDYVSWESVPNTPRVCLKIPTGGGKTIVAAYAVKVVSDTWLERENPVVLWFTPSDTIRRQTAEALKNPRHPYRAALDEQFDGCVRIFDIDEKFNIRPADIEGGACVIVSTMQSFVKEDTSKYNVYRDNENLESHFVKMRRAQCAGMEMLDDGSRPKYSFANLLYYHRPVMIVDEAHKVVTNLSQETQRRLNPAAIIEFTATPHPHNNTLYNVRPSELKEEEMIKLPIELREHSGWESAVDEAIAKRAELEKAVENESEYIRPILLFQAQSKDKEVTVEALKNYLVETSNLPENQIKIATGEQKELDDIDLFNPDEPTRYIITVEALKEGWDCSFAYVLCSLANIKSDTSVEQLLGRVMRMPYAKSRKTVALNKAYAYVLSKAFGEAAGALVEKLAKKGFDDTEARTALELMPSELDSGLFDRHDMDKIDLDEPLLLAEPPETIYFENGGQTIVFTPETTSEDIELVVQCVPEKKADEIKWKYSCYKLAREDSAPSPARLGERFSVPRLMVELQGELVFAEPEVIFEAFDWDIAKFAKPEMNAGEFNIEPQGNGFSIDIDGHRLIYSPTGAEQCSLPLVEVENWTSANLIRWFDKSLHQEDIPQPQMVEWLRRMIEHLINMRGMKLSALMLAKYALANKIEAKIKKARNDAKKTAFQTTFIKRKNRVMLDFDNGFVFFESMYGGEICYQGKYRFKKHFLGANKVPLIYGGESGEEFKCAMALDAEPQVKFWLRNVAKHPASFRLPTSDDNFYPDFVAKLQDGRILVVEYKGEHIATSDETKEKVLIGEIWEKESKGAGLFLLAVKDMDGLNVSEQIKKKIGRL